MINSYCRLCGLYLSVPDEFAGGRGGCPRCKTALQIPTPIPENSPGHVEYLRYIAEPADQAAAGATPVIVTDELSDSIKYNCSNCKCLFESLKAPGWTQGQCPSCETVNDDSTGEVVTFPRQLASAPKKDSPPTTTDSTKPSWNMEGDFLVAEAHENQSLSDSVIEPLPFRPEDLTPKNTTDQ